MNHFPLKIFLLRVTKSVTFGLITFVNISAFAGYDLTIDGSVRSYPLGAALTVDAGNGLLAWGSEPTGGTDKNPWYGYIRPNAFISTAGTWNQAGVALDIYPVSIFGVRLGTSMTSNDADYSAYECTTVRCQGDWSHQYARAELILGYDIFFGVVQARIEDWHESKMGIGAYIEPESGVRMEPGHDRILMQRIVLGMNPSETWTFLGMITINTSERAKDRSEAFVGIAQYKFDEFSIAGGAGLYGSDLKDQAVTMLVRFAWTPFPSLALN